MTHKGKKFFVDDEGNAEPVEEKPAEGGTPAEGGVPADADIDAAAEKAAETIMSKLPLDKLTKAIEALSEHQAKMTPKAKDLLGGELTKEKVDKMTTREKIVKFFQAAVQQDHVTLKALAEGTAGAGGYVKFVH